MCDTFIAIGFILAFTGVISGMISSFVEAKALKEIKEKNIRLYRKLYRGYDFLYPDYVMGRPSIKIQARIQKVLCDNRWKISEIIGDKQKDFKILYRYFKISLLAFLILISIVILFCNHKKIQHQFDNNSSLIK